MNPMAAESLFYCDKSGVKKRQVTIELRNSSCILSSEAMQWTVRHKVTRRSNFSSAIAGGERLVNVYRGTGKILMAPVR